MASILRGSSSLSLFPSLLRLLSTSFSAYGIGASKYSSFSVNSLEQSSAYLEALRCKPPTRIKRYKIPSLNSVSLMGTILCPIRRFWRQDGPLVVWTLLGNKPTSNSSSTFRILLRMHDEMANIALEHLRPNDSVYVSGCFSSNKKADATGSSEVFHMVVVKELNYVKYNIQVQTCKNPDQREHKEDMKPISDMLTFENETERLGMWHVFFANPHEWWDNRNRKEKGSERFPDFKHKDTRECLSLRPDDPPWVRKQLELFDSRMKEEGGRALRSRQSCRVSTWEYNE